MLNLVLTTDKLALITSAAVTVDVHASFVDLSGTTVTPGKQNTAISTATTTDIVAAPAASTVRNVKTLHIRNKHATSPVDVTVQYNANAVLGEIHKATLRAGEMLEYVEGVGFFLVQITSPTVLMKVLSADDAGGQNVATAQPWFPTQGAVTVEGDTSYRMSGFLRLTRAAGVVSHTTGLLFAGTASLTSILYNARSKSGDVEANAALNATISAVATNTTVKAASVSATETISVDIDGVVRINAGGTFIPQFIYSAAPGGAPTVTRNTIFRLEKIGGGSFVTAGTWA